MSSAVVEGDVTVSLARVQAELDVLLGLDLALLPEAELVELLRSLEQIRCRSAAVESHAVVEVERRGVPVTVGARTTTNYLCWLLHLDPYDASARVRAAQAIGVRQSLVGEVLAPRYPAVARAQAAGTLAPKQAAVIVRHLDALPDAVVEEIPAVEAELVAAAAEFDPYALGKIAARRCAYLDQDGVLADVEYRRRHRDLSLTRSIDGSGVLRGDVTAELAEYLDVVFDSLAAPAPAADGAQDPRTAGQRRHDALLELAKLGMRTDHLAPAGGITATIVLTVPAEDWTTSTGFTQTGHGAQIPTTEARAWVGGDTAVIAVALNSMRQISHYGSSHRIFTRNQRLAIAARDQHCTFPGCTIPPAWTQTHHVQQWQDHGPTSVDNGTLLCGFHHREFQNLGWSVAMPHGVPEWTPPPWLDPEQRPVTPARLE